MTKKTSKRNIWKGGETGQGEMHCKIRSVRLARDTKVTFDWSPRRCEGSAELRACVFMSQADRRTSAKALGQERSVHVGGTPRSQYGGPCGPGECGDEVGEVGGSGQVKHCGALDFIQSAW